MGDYGIIDTDNDIQKRYLPDIAQCNTMVAAGKRYPNAKPM